MGAINWHKNLSVGIQRLDEQHKKLIVIINNLYDIIANQQKPDELKDIIDEMAEYAVIHFSTEEKYFKQFGYPEAEIHNEEHNQFIRKLDEFKAGFQSGSFSLSFQMMDFLQDWLVHHIVSTDKKYTNFFRKNGLQ